MMKKLFKMIPFVTYLSRGTLGISFIGAIFASEHMVAQCASSAVNTPDDEIFNVTFGTLNNTSSCGTTGGPGSQINLYSNYTGTVLAAQNVTVNLNYPLSVTVGQCNGNQYGGYVGAWIDYNHNGAFTDAGELVYMSGYNVWAVAGSIITATNGVTIPSNASLGITRMRVVAQEVGTPSPCGTYAFGETEDYDINIVAAPPCTTTPIASSVVAPTGSLCSGQSLDLYTSPTNTAGGVAYSWQSSTTSSVGPYTAIASGSVSVFGTRFSTSTWVRLVTTCSAISSSIAATPAQIIIAATTVSNVPYFEGFEETTVQNNLGPNCSWSISDTIVCHYGSSASNGNIFPNNGNGLAWFGGGTTPHCCNTPPPIEYNFYSNGIQLNAGVTYSAAVFYNGCVYSPFSLSYSASQSTNNATQIATTANFCNGNYQSLSDTFHVTSSGVYYIIISASTSYPSVIFAFDDLSVTAPCTFTNNLATTSLSAAPSICLGESTILNASGANSYTWSTGATGGSITVTPINGTMYTVTGTKAISGCSLTQTAYIIVNPTPAMQILANPSSICTGQSSSLIAIGSSNSYTWSEGTSGPNAYSVAVTPTNTTTYTLTGINVFNCLGYATQTIAVNPTPTITVTGNQKICKGEPGTLMASGATSYIWSSSSSFLTTNPISPFPNITTSYIVTGKDVSGCAGQTTLTQTVNICTSVKTNQNTLSSLLIYPNPNNGLFTVDLNNGFTKNIELMDITGRMIISSVSDHNQIDVNITNLANGIYYVKVKSEGATEILKIVKQ